MNKVFFAFSTFLCSLAAFGQGTFQNLNFEMAGQYLSDLAPGQFEQYVPTNKATPGWVVCQPNAGFPYAGHNCFTIEAAAVAVLGPGYDTNYIIQGKYTALLEASSLASSVSTSIAQNGTVPTWAKSLQYWSGGNGTLVVSVGGQVLQPVSLSSSASGAWTFYGADIAAFAGQTVDLRFTSQYTQYPNRDVYLDGISFSSAIVPEPAVLTIIGIAILGLGFWRLLRLSHNNRAK